MALPQTVDQSTLNLSGKPALSARPAPTITSPGSAGVASPTIATETSQVSPVAGALMGYLLGNYMDRTSGGSGGTSGAGTAGGIGGVLNSIFGNKPTTTGGTSGGTSSPTNAGNTVKPGVPAGNTPGIGGTSVNSISLPAGTDQASIDAKYGTTNGQSNYVISGVNMSNGNVIATPNYGIGGANLGTSGGNFGVTDTTPSTPDTTSTAPTPSDTYAGYYQNAQGDIYDSNGSLMMIKLSDGNWYDPNMDMYFDPNFMPVDTGALSSADQAYSDYYNSDEYMSGSDTAYQDWLNSTDNSYYSPIDTTGSPWGYTPSTDTSVYSPIDTSIGPSWKKGGLATPMFAKGGGVKGYATGDLVTNSGTIYDSTGQQVYPNYSTSTPVAATTAAATPTATTLNVGTGGYDPTATTTSAPASSTTGGGTSILGAIQNLFSSSGAKGAALGALLTQLMGSSTQPVNKGVDMTALSSMKPRTTPFGMGPANYVPYSEYGTPPSTADYSTLFQNLGVSPFNRGATTPTMTSAVTPAISKPAGALNTTAPTAAAPVATPTAPSAPMYYSDANGNIYDANGDLVYDTTTGTVSSTPTTSTGIAATGINPNPVMQSGSTTAVDPYYSYGTPVTPSSVLAVKKGGLAEQKLALGGQPITDNLNVPVSNKPFSNVPSIQGRGDYRTGAYVEGAGDGQSDDIPAMLADGEYVIDAETVAQLGNGSNKAGAKVLDQFRQNIRAHKRSAPHDKIPPKSKSPLAYLKGAK